MWPLKSIVMDKPREQSCEKHAARGDQAYPKRGAHGRNSTDNQSFNCIEAETSYLTQRYTYSWWKERLDIVTPAHPAHIVDVALVSRSIFRQ